MSGSIRRWKLMGVGALIVVLQCLLVTGRAWAQNEVNRRAIDEGTGAWPWLVGLLLFVVVAGAGFLNAKRSHLD